MNREQQEMALWREAYTLAISQGANYGEADKAATTAAESFRKRYPAEPTATEPTAPGLAWYDEPPFPKDRTMRPCWVLGEDRPCMVYWGWNQWFVVRVGGLCAESLAGRRVSPIAKPPEPTT